MVACSYSPSQVRRRSPGGNQAFSSHDPLPDFHHIEFLAFCSLPWVRPCDSYLLLAALCQDWLLSCLPTPVGHGHSQLPTVSPEPAFSPLGLWRNLLTGGFVYFTRLPPSQMSEQNHERLEILRINKFCCSCMYKRKSSRVGVDLGIADSFIQRAN